MTDVKTAFITRDVIENAYNYEEYRELVERLLEEGKTTGENHSEKMLHYTKMNIHRMKRLDKQIELKEELVSRLHEVERSMIWLVLTEGWCGDNAQSIPAIQKMAYQNKKIQTWYILRDENLEIMDCFLTDGRSRSIPKLICIDAKSLDILGDWGPRPIEAQLLFKTMKNSPEYSSREAAEWLHRWYAEDKTYSMQDEFFKLLDEWENRM